MSKLVSISAVLGIAMSTAILISSPSLAGQMKFKADMSASQVVPPNDSAGKGNAHITFDTVSRKLSWTIEYFGLTGPVKAGHFHGPAGPGENGGVEVPLNKLKSPIKGSATLSKDQAKALLDGKFYVNLHTAAHGDGEIRGQVVKAKM
jgi:CHRD domain-containing protein